MPFGCESMQGAHQQKAPTNRLGLSVDGSSFWASAWLGAGVRIHVVNIRSLCNNLVLHIEKITFISLGICPNGLGVKQLVQVMRLRNGTDFLVVTRLMVMPATGS
jgi:hypothetical protein